MSVRRGFRKPGGVLPATPDNRLTPENALKARPAGRIAIEPTMVLPPAYLQLGPIVATFQLTLPPPLSRLTRNAAGPGRAATREAKAWREANQWALRSPHGWDPFDFPVDVWIYLGLKASQMVSDVANREKAVTDLLVWARIIHNDSTKWVRSNHQVWHPNLTGCVIEVRRWGP